MEQLTAAIVGTGDPSDPGPDGFGMAYQHADAYQQLEGVSLVACADIVEANAAAFAESYGLSQDAIFTDAESMVEAIDPAIVSICTPVPTHAPLVRDVIERGESLRAIHCEKPMATTWGDATDMHARADEAGIQLTFNHQRRFGAPFTRARDLIESGRIGDVERIEFGSGNLFDYGTHSIDLANFLNGEVDPTWVLANVDTRDATEFFDAYNENQAVALWAYENGVHGFASTGDGADAVPPHHRVLGTEGIIELGTETAQLRVRGREERGWETIDTGEEHMHGPGYIERAMGEVVESLRTGSPSALRSENALRATSIIFGAYESARRNRRVEFPLTFEDNPLYDLIESAA